MGIFKVSSLFVARRRLLSRAALGCALLAMSGTALAGPFILDLTDADDHGSFNITNQEGWFYMQRVLENLAPGVTNGNKVVVSLGSTNSSSSVDAFDAANSAFQQSSISSGWTWVNIDGAAAITDFFTLTGTTGITLDEVGIITIDSGTGNVTGGITAAELAVINANATALDNFLGGGGGLHSMDEDANGQYGWLTTLLPGLTFNTASDTGLHLTTAGNTAFPGLSDSDLSAGPHHGHWTGDLSGLTVLFTDVGDTDAVGIGSSGGSITQPDPVGVPEPPMLLLFGAGLVAVGLFVRRRRA